ncbi:putative membrane transporter protein [Hyella patelloides LEGE 07179]|uniref:Probable membrane transporter protein n=1 Tax=Hyella patelloides LEGE 07179 TaxID=945734 RepID=A0A563VY81_9CYAN|nr:sulfite exporter TauE/SafE family protein [Hyella patelloides]VEP16365.1 putative membrane transporter protein [Hyella patelloides LEGE 07179]
MDLFGNEYVAVSSIILLAALAQSITGFGFSIVAMSFLPGVVGLQTSVPLVTLFNIIGNIVLWYYHRRDFSLKTVGQLTIAALVTTPMGILLLDLIPEAIALKGLGILIISYVIYDWFNLSLPKLQSSLWAYAFGGASGVLNGAYTINGPPLIVYANCRRWTPQEFKGNLTALFFFSSLVAAIAHGIQGNITISVWKFTVYSIPIYVVGLCLGMVLSKKIEPLVFRRITLALLLVAGLRLLV